ncbi:MAG TPA: LuxR C-terminal-related transcriptional regulator [Verrucomicrobiae bacterium]|nr:LuxR C-terminal-related transcriptional regulator [Verrucomicrobiae bacterium]
MEGLNGIQFQKQITKREIEVLALVAEGYSNKEIADRLLITQTTARTHLTNIYRKLHVRRRTEAAIRFLRFHKDNEREIDYAAGNFQSAV